MGETNRSRANWRWAFIAAVGLLLAIGLARQADAYETYHDPTLDGAGYCASCHPGFPNRDDTHDLHVTPFTNTCNLCHTGAGRNNPFTVWSVEDPGGFGCAGCHGGDYGETIQLPNGYDNGSGTFDLNGLPKQSGYGTRKQHLRKGVTVCLGCHADVGRSFVKEENVNPVYYARTDTDPSDACSSTDEDSTPEILPCPVGSCSTTVNIICRNDSDCPQSETCQGIVACTSPFTGNEDSVGLDNDGEALDNPLMPRIDDNDPDCASFTGTPTPGEAAAPFGGNPLLVTGYAAGNITINYGGACSANDHSLYVGALTQTALQNGDYSQKFCAIGVGGPFVFNPGAGSFFFLVAGDDGTTQGSYGESYFSDATDPMYPNLLIYRERPADAINSCNRTYDLALRCD
jgi:hypothetical protein